MLNEDKRATREHHNQKNDIVSMPRETVKTAQAWIQFAMLIWRLSSYQSKEKT